MKKPLITLLLITMLPATSFATSNVNPVKQIQNDLSTFAASWNQGEIDQVIKHYKQSKTTTLLWSEPTYGYQNIASYLHENYSAKETMGTLSTSNVKIQLLSANYAMVTGAWSITGSKDKDAGGSFSMLYEKTPLGWKIILDHGAA